MPSQRLVELVNKYQKAGIQISFTKPRTKISMYLYEAPTADMTGYLSHEKNSKQTILEYI